MLTIMVLCASVLAKAQQVKLNINITKIEAGKGTVVLNIYDKKEDFLKTVFLSKTLKADQSDLTFVVDLPKKGSYAVTVFQDLDNNKKLKQDWFGIPQEPVGYGNNFKPSAKPKFKECAVNVDSDNTTQTIKLY
ncbi:Uncharacterized conserved protein, DUF2141 family [Pedobacter caeni]|uniref:Uncharacterized conserved protein, DUF2141 family n=2 Tax=Pedobacter caeni TaxID=288992 RepID=A0A1M4W7S3_9SPHI|nr:Uncharacterized conserved protein, DUF2141 family [Pedobacter caeni]